MLQYEKATSEPLNAEEISEIPITFMPGEESSSKNFTDSEDLDDCDIIRIRKGDSTSKDLSSLIRSNKSIASEIV